MFNQKKQKEFIQRPNDNWTQINLTKLQLVLILDHIRVGYTSFFL